MATPEKFKPFAKNVLPGQNTGYGGNNAVPTEAPKSGTTETSTSGNLSVWSRMFGRKIRLDRLGRLS